MERFNNSAQNIIMRASFTIPINEVEAMRTLAGTDETRYALCGVLFEITKDSVLLVATDGRKMGIMKSSAKIVELQGDKLEVTIPCIMISRLPKEKGGVAKVCVNETKVSFENKYGEVVEKLIDANYPAWRGVVPKADFAPSRVNLSSTLITDFDKCAKKLCPGNAIVSLVPHGDELLPVSVFIGNNKSFYGIVMPARQEPNVIPEWCKQVPPL